MSADRDMTRIVRSWLRTDEHESADRILDSVLAVLDATPQRHRLRPARRLVDVNIYLKTAIAAAAVLVVAVVSISLLSGGRGDAAAPPATPSPNPSGSPAAEAPPGPLVVTAAISNGPDIGRPTFTRVEGRVERRGTIRALPFTASDPRLQGSYTHSADQDAYPGPNGPESFVFAAETIRIETADGAWQGSASGFQLPDESVGRTVILVGEGGYEGLYAALDMTHATDSKGIRGVIFPAAPPPAPAPSRSPSPSASPAADASPAGPVVVTADIRPGNDIGQTVYRYLDGRVERRGTIWSPTITASDARLQGTITIGIDQDAYPGPNGPESFVLLTSTPRIETADGAWQGSSSSFISGEGSGLTVVLVGEGAYEGLFAALDMTDAARIHGVIFPAPPPPAPAAP